MPTSVASADLESSYYPSAKLRLILRFDEFGSTSSVVQSAQKLVPHTVLRGTSSPRAPLVVSADPASPPGVNRLLLQPANSAQLPGGPQGQTSSPDALTFAVAGIIPKSATWEVNGIRTADTLTAKIKWIDCPLDPRTLRSVAVEYFLGTVSADDYAAGVDGATRQATTGQTLYQEPINLIPDQYADASGTQRTNLRFQGFVDRWIVDETSEGEEATITLECRDNTQLLIDVEAPAGLAIGSNLPIDQAVANYLANFPTFAGLSVQYLPSGQSAPVLGTALAGSAYQKALGGVVPSRGGGAVQKLAVWDFLTDVAGSLGLVIYIDGTTITLQQPQTLFAQQSAGGSSGRSDDPFVVMGGRTVDGDTFTRRRFVWGRNLKRQQVTRNFNKNAPTNIEVRCYSPRRKRQLVARFPDPVSQRAQLGVHALPGGSADQKWLVWRVRGIEDPTMLASIAAQVYQNGRNEFLVELDTEDLASYGGGNLDPDVLDMKVGDAFDMLVAQDTDSGSLGEVEQQLIAQTESFMSSLGFDPGLAAAYAKAYGAMNGFQTTFRLKAMSVEWRSDAGEEASCQITVHGVNYVEVRLDAPLGS